MFLQAHSNNALLMQKLFLSLANTEEIFSILMTLKKLDSMETSLLQEFEIYLLK